MDVEARKGTNSAPPALVSVQEMGSLVSLKVNYANVLEFNNRITQEISKHST